ncbi:MAG: hypothetical protein AB1756_08450 [Acidobacteriota bacterium]
MKKIIRLRRLNICQWQTLQTVIGVAVIVSLFLLGSCASAPITYIHPSSDFSAIKKVAVLPFSNYTQDLYADEKIRDLFIIELLAANIVGVAEPGEVYRALAENKITDIENLGQDNIRKIGQTLDVQALIQGNVQEFQIERSGTTPSVTIALSFKMIEVDSGVAIWTTTVSREGTKFITKLFGFGGANKSKAARKLVRKALKTLIQ